MILSHDFISTRVRNEAYPPHNPTKHNNISSRQVMRKVDFLSEVFVNNPFSSKHMIIMANAIKTIKMRVKPTLYLIHWLFSSVYKRKSKDIKERKRKYLKCSKWFLFMIISPRMFQKYQHFWWNNIQW